MRFKKGEQIEVKVEPFGSSMKYYSILYRRKKRINLFNSWRILVEVYDGASLSYDQPVLISDFNYACDYASKIKENPLLINEHYDKEDEKYERISKQRKEYLMERNKTAKF